MFPCKAFSYICWCQVRNIFKPELSMIIHFAMTIVDCRTLMFEHHTNLHHSQTILRCMLAGPCLSPILIYIILKLATDMLSTSAGLSTILIYIILKPQIQEGKPHQA